MENFRTQLLRFRFGGVFAEAQAFPRGEGGPPERSEDTAGRMRDGVQLKIHNAKCKINRLLLFKFRFVELFATHQAFPRGEGGPPERSEDTAGRMRDGVQLDIE